MSLASFSHRFMSFFVYSFFSLSGFYWGHRAFHSHPLIYRWVHKHHHRWTHSISLAAEDSSTIDWLFSAAIPFVVGPKLCGGHAAMIACWMAYRISATLEGHSGYAFPFSFLRITAAFAGPGDAHDAHHSLNTGDFGSSLPFWDWLFNTRIPHEKVVRSGKRRPTTEEAAKGIVCKLAKSDDDDDGSAADGGFAADSKKAN
jgi:sterol desaturase/sphingolipid hydroxylase (fatty acid hydroxylase superfamily)